MSIEAISYSQLADDGDDSRLDDRQFSGEMPEIKVLTSIAIQEVAKHVDGVNRSKATVMMELQRQKPTSISALRQRYIVESFKKIPSQDMPLAKRGRYAKRDGRRKNSAGMSSHKSRQSQVSKRSVDSQRMANVKQTLDKVRRGTHVISAVSRSLISKKASGKNIKFMRKGHSNKVDDGSADGRDDQVDDDNIALKRKLNKRKITGYIRDSSMRVDIDNQPPTLNDLEDSNMAFFSPMIKMDSKNQVLNIKNNSFAIRLDSKKEKKNVNFFRRGSSKLEKVILNELRRESISEYVNIPGTIKKDKLEEYKPNSAISESLRASLESLSVLGQGSPAKFNILPVDDTHKVLGSNRQILSFSKRPKRQLSPFKVDPLKLLEKNDEKQTGFKHSKFDIHKNIKKILVDPHEIENPLDFINHVFRKELKKQQIKDRRYCTSKVAKLDVDLPDNFNHDFFTSKKTGLGILNDLDHSPINSKVGRRTTTQNISPRAKKRGKLKIFNPTLRGRGLEVIGGVKRTPSQEEFFKVWEYNRCGGLYKKFPFADPTEEYLKAVKDNSFPNLRLHRINCNHTN